MAAGRLEIQVTWLREGDANTNFFHSFANSKHISNMIWDLKNYQGQWCHSQDLLKQEAISHFSTVFKDLKTSLISDQLKVIKHYPSFFTREEAMAIDYPVTGDEIEGILKCFAKDKSLGPDG